MSENEVTILANPPLEPGRSRPAPATRAPTADARLGIRIHARLDAAEADWRALEARGVLTPYQAYDWIAALVAAGLEPCRRLAIAVLTQGDRPVGLLPLALDRRPGFTQARLIGAPHSNADWLVLDPAMVASLTATVLRLLLEEIAVEAGGIDVFRLFNQPERWGGIANPVLALSRRQGPNNLYFAAVAGAPLPFADHRLPPRHRGNIRRGARRLTESLGPLTLRRADTVAEIERQHAAFLAQRARRFAVMGIDNIFGEPEFVAFFRRLALEGRGRPRPALAFHALYAGEEIVATSIGTFQGGHYSQYINSTASTGPAARTSLIGILMDRLADELVAGGIASIDMGTGDFPYKTDWTAPQPLYHSTVPITRRGALALPALEAASALKRTIKQDQRLWTIAQRTRRLIYRARHWREKE